MTIILARIFGIYFLLIGIAFLINTDRFKRIYKQVLGDENFLLLGAIIAILIGAVVVSVHNYWILGWPVLITILGWWSLIKGFMIIALPDSLKLFSFIEDKSNNFYRAISLFYIVIGMFLIYKGWFSIDF